jgi:hypothetical protein
MFITTDLILMYKLYENPRSQKMDILLSGRNQFPQVLMKIRRLGEESNLLGVASLRGAPKNN